MIDAIDQFTAKCHLLATCRERGIPVVSCMGAAGRWDPTRIQITDLNKTHHDKMALNVRKILRKNTIFQRVEKRGVFLLFSAMKRCSFPNSLHTRKIRALSVSVHRQ